MRTLLFSGRRVRELLAPDLAIAAVEKAFRWLGEGRIPRPETVGVAVEGGGFHVKAGAGEGSFTVKINGNFPANPERLGLPTIQGLVALFDAGDGRPLAVLDSAEITALRTAAATAVAARHLARPDSGAVTLVGCGRQGRAQLRALARVLPLRRVLALDSDRLRAEAFAREMAPELGVEVSSARDLGSALEETDVLVTCTPSRKAYVRKAQVRPGTFIAAVGADNEDKQELEESLMAASAVVTDLTTQAARIGDLHHAVAAGRMRTEDVRAELGAVVAGKSPGRVSKEEVTIFDSTGIAIQDLAAAVAVYEAASSFEKEEAAFDFSG
jgi:ornithine cyclodeaminase/alanine dehydrogenase-like protein (mu-crystallin family)